MSGDHLISQKLFEIFICSRLLITKGEADTTGFHPELECWAIIVIIILRLFSKFLCGGLQKPSLSFFNVDKRQNPQQLKPRGVDGCLGTGASQDHLVGFHQLTILAGQGNIRELLVLFIYR